MEIKTLGDLITKTEAELLAYKNFGETSLQEIKDILAQKGLRLGMGRDAADLGIATREEAEAELDALFGGKGRDEGDEDEDEDLDDEEAEDEGQEGAGGGAASTGEDARSMPIEGLDLSTRARRCVEALEIETVGDLADRTEAELMLNKNFGMTSLAEIKKKLEGLGLALKGGSSETPAE
jgi:DNA-directed RNA polymerase subunit alpha